MAANAALFETAMDERPTPDPRIYNDCLRLFVEYKGRNIVGLEREMRSLGHERFNRRILYTRHEKGLRKPGWIERFDWRTMPASPLSEPSQVCDGQTIHPPITIGDSDSANSKSEIR